jgi:membrane-bound metal-dependent hydrolase YbcI (DUF457 family)
MPLPAGHALAGIGLQRAWPGLFFRKGWHDALFCMLLANLPDADFLPGLLMGRPNLYHHGAFHSLGAALAVALLVAGMARLAGRRAEPAPRRAWQPAAVAFLILSSHLLLDCFTIDQVPPFGLPLLWPVSGRYVIASRPIFLDVTRSAAAGDFFISIFSRHNLAAALREAALVGGVALCLALWRAWRDRRRTLPPG